MTALKPLRGAKCLGPTEPRPVPVPRDGYWIIPNTYLLQNGDLLWVGEEFDPHTRIMIHDGWQDTEAHGGVQQTNFIYCRPKLGTHMQNTAPIKPLKLLPPPQPVTPNTPALGQPDKLKNPKAFLATITPLFYMTVEPWAVQEDELQIWNLDELPGITVRLGMKVTDQCKVYIIYLEGNGGYEKFEIASKDVQGNISDPFKFMGI